MSDERVCKCGAPTVHLPSQHIQEADTGVVTPAELEDITDRHNAGIYEPWELNLEKWEI